MRGAVCLVTGGAGAIGGHLVEALLARGASVDVLDDLSAGRRENLPTDGRIRLIAADITRPDLRRFLPRRDYDYVFHLAAHFANALSIEEPRRDLEVNLLGTLNLLHALAPGPARRFVFASTSCIYGANGCGAEALALRPDELDTPYAVGKFAAEAAVHFWARHRGLKATVLRYFNSYGPRDWPGPARGVIPNFLALAMRGRPLPIYGSGEETRDFTYVSDIVSATINAAAGAETDGRTLNAGSGRETTLRELPESVNELTGNRAGLIHLPRRAWDRCARRVADLSASRDLLGLESPVPIEEGLARTWAWAREAFAKGT